MTQEHPPERNESEIRRLMDQIDAEYQAAQLALTGLNLGTAQHQFITARLERIGAVQEHLVELVGENEAGRLIVEQMNKSANKGEQQ